MFIVSKLIESFLLPSNLIGLLGVLGLLCLLLRRPRLGRNLLAAAAVFFALAGWSPLGPAALVALENRFPRPQLEGTVTGMIMLGGAVDTHITADRGTPTLTDAAERVTTVAELSRQYPDARILLSGGASDIASPEPVTESAVAGQLLVAMGVAADRIELEERSRTTCENAEQSKLLARPATGEQWLLITSASHMPRAIACFRAVGFQVLPYPVDYRTQGTADLRRPVHALAQGLDALDLAAHEWIGLLTYRLLGKTRELLPSR